MSKSLGIVVALVLLVGGLSAFAYKSGYSKAETRYLAELNRVQDAARQREHEWIDYGIERTEAAAQRLGQFLQRTDEDSMLWATHDIPAGELTRMRAALCEVSTSACWVAD